MQFVRSIKRIVFRGRVVLVDFGVFAHCADPNIVYQFNLNLGITACNCI